MSEKPKWVEPFSWILFFIVLVPPIYVWGESINWGISDLGAIQLFPLLGLLAFSIMWSHFAVGTLKRMWPLAFNYKKYFRFTSNAVLVLILLHPLLLFFQSQRRRLYSV